MTIQYNFSLSSHNTFRMNAIARVWAEYASVEELKEILSRNDAGEFGEGKPLPIIPIGEGSNILFTRDVDGLVLHSVMQRARALDEDAEYVSIEAESGMVLDNLIAQLTDMGLSGMENLSNIPGTVGAAAVQNVGAYRTEAKDVIEKVMVLDTQSLTIVEMSNEQCRFGYRDSWFKHQPKGQYIVLSVIFRLQKNALCSPIDKRNEIIQTRAAKLPDVRVLGSAGSFFKNPVIPSSQAQALLTLYPSMPHFEQDGGVKIPAAWLIEQCGWKGKSLSDQPDSARVYEKQPLVIVNGGNASASDVIALADAIITSVSDKFGITLSPEVEYIPFL